MVETQALQGKTVVITGATDGIGRELAKMSWKAGANLILHGRNPLKLAKLQTELGEGLPEQRLETVQANYSCLAEVREMAQQIMRLTPKLDILVNNAGFYPEKRVITQDGFEECNQVNFLAPFLLTTLLRPLLIKSAPMKVVNLSSIGHRYVWSDVNAAVKQPFYWRWVAYCRSKLDMIPFTRELAEQLSEFGITVNCIHPGVIRTKVIRFLPVSWGASVQDGAQTVFRLMADPALAHVTGKYFERYKIVQPSIVAQSKRYQAALWRLTLRRLGLKQETDGSIVLRQEMNGVS